MHGKRKEPVSIKPFGINWRCMFFAALALVLALAFAAFVSPETAFAQNGSGAAFGGNFAGIIGTIEWVVRMVFLPVGIIIASAKLIYIAIVGGMFGVDPLKIITDSDTVSEGDVTAALKEQLWGFAKGLGWVAGLFVIFEIALNIAAFLAQSVENVFG